ncbi:hypothetical protein [Sphingobium subterraneum]|uniref:Uncharacterized protein n=1 Tax=Sphingobium subterraneum TaxID=627688 RepID=A0A841IYY1_9SPHN|nr:hypothetical protein [Sphingobium subterraneum]MBB6122486.1 hypothetical protein [Sphingobium subterraneum]
MPVPSDTPRKIYVVMSARSLPYAQCCLESLARNAIEPIDVTLITDDPSDKKALTTVVEAFGKNPGQRWTVFDKADADDRASLLYADFPAIRQFREGHPCWRKITDPPLFAQAGEEMIILDPDVYFPNRFCFEPTPAQGLLLMWQRPNCLLPEATVRTAFEADIPMADHTDIGVAHARFPLDWAFLNRLIVELGGDALPRSMHVESIIWAALAKESGGAYLDPATWYCFANSVPSRLRRRFGQSGNDTLAALDIAHFKCIHGGGVAKNWFPEAERAGILSGKATLDAPTPAKPYVDFPRAKFERKFALRRLAARLGLYRILGSE